MKAETSLSLSTGATVSVDDRRVRVDLSAPPSSSYQSMSSAILNGGCRTIDANDEGGAPTAHVINCRVPSTYDGLNPPPLELLSNFARKEEIDPSKTVGLLTAASMESVSTSSRSAMGVSIDVIVTAGLSNSRSAGADADYFVVCETNSDGVDDGSKAQEIKPGTINTIVIVDTPLTLEAMVEAYAIAIEAKCSACVNHGIMCQKDQSSHAMGTGTDCCVLLSPGCDATATDVSGNKQSKSIGRVIKQAGKHTLFAEILGQAVEEATSEAIMINIRHLHGSYAAHAAKRWLQVLSATTKGARPCVPPRPMMPVSNAPPSILLMGVCLVALVYVSPLTDEARLVLAAVAWDRYLGEPPLRFHPVCLAGSAISLCLKYTPERAYQIPVLGLTCGLLLLASMLLVFMAGSWVFVQFAHRLAAHGPSILLGVCNGYCNEALAAASFDVPAWILRVLLLKSTFSLQLLCTIALQMARYLERGQIEEARSQLSWLCSRDPSRLNLSELAGATLESLSENLSDGFVAPLFWYVLLGPVGAIGYRTINTLDSRIGYRNGKYEWFGKASARLDDLINLAPARMTAMLLSAAACIVRGPSSARKGLRTAWKDSGRCASPNAGWPMACLAGVLGVRLEKSGEYRLGAEGSEPGTDSVRDGHRVAQVAGGLAVLAATVSLVNIT